MCGGCISSNPITKWTLFAFNGLNISGHIGPLLKGFTNKETTGYLKQLHQSAHAFRPFSETMCLLGDMVDITTGHYFQYLSGTGKFRQGLGRNSQDYHLDYLRTAGKMSHTVSHFLSTLSFFKNDLKIFRFSYLKAALPYSTLISAVAYAFYSASLLVNHCSRPASIKDFSLQAGMFGTGFIAEVLELSSDWNLIGEEYESPLGKVAALASIISSLCSNILLSSHIHEKRKKSVSL